MGKNNIMKMYNDVGSDISFLLRSKSRREILDVLSGEYKSIKHISDSSEIHLIITANNIRELHELGYVNEFSRKFARKNVTDILLTQLNYFLNVFELVYEYGELWYEHDIQSIPKEILTNLGCLHNPNLIESTTTDIYRNKDFSKQNISNSTHIKAIFSAYDHEYFDFLFSLNKTNGAKIDIIITKDVFDFINNNSNNLLFYYSKDIDNDFNLNKSNFNKNKSNSNLNKSIFNKNKSNSNLNKSIFNKNKSNSNLNKSIFNKSKSNSNLNKHGSNLNKSTNKKSKNNLNIFLLNKKTDIMCISGDNFISIGLFNSDGTYDSNLSLTSQYDESKDLCNYIFNLYKINSERLFINYENFKLVKGVLNERKS